MITEDNILNAKILIIDDDEISVRILKETFSKAGYKNITSINDPRLALKLYKELDPDLLILDLNMPYLSGFDVMKQLTSINIDGYLPIVVLSNEESQDIRSSALEAGARDFLNKPYDRVEVLIRFRNLIEVRLLHNEIRDQNKSLENKVRQRTQEVYETQRDVINRLARAVEYRDSETGLHIVRMSHYAACLADEAGLSNEECGLILMASPLHDIGKIGIPDSILQKPGKLTPEEWEIMKTHTVIGGELLSGGNSEFLNLAKEIALTHHEKWDGSGYPEGLKEKGIPLCGRICGLCDVFDALMTCRPYKRAWTVEETLDVIKEGKGTHFDPELVEHFLTVLPQIKLITDKYVDPILDDVSLD